MEDTNFQEQWKIEQVSEATKVVEGLVARIEQLKQLPESKDAARKMIAVEDIANLSSLANRMSPEGLDRRQLLAAILRGRGLKHQEIADLMELPGGAATVHTWETELAPFRLALHYWMQVTEQDQRSMALREIEELAATVDDPKVRVNLLRLRLLLADKPEDRARWIEEMKLREREVAAKEKEVGGVTDTKPPFVIPPYIDAEFTTSDSANPPQL